MKELNLLERAIVAPFINEEDKETIAVYPGAFKPPHRGHLSVVEKANAVADKTIVVISQADRDGFTAEDSLKIWEIYTKDMPNVEVRIASKPSPVSEAYSLFKHNPEKNYVMALGKNEFSRVGHLDRYHNAKPFDAGTLEDLSSTNLRQAIRENDNDAIQNFLPEGVNLEEYLKVFIKEDHYPENFLQDSITSFAQYMEDSGMQIAPPPRVEFVNDDVENAENLLGKTAFYNPEENVIVLYTLGRHPKDILRSFAHEMIHHIQNLEGRLGGINTTNTNEDDYLDQIEREAYEHGNMTFRNWTDSLLNGDNLNENEEDNFDNELESFAKQLGSEIEDEIEEKGGLKEAVGIVGIIGWILLSNTVANMLSKFAKKQFAKYDFGKGEAAAKKIYDFTHKNEEAFKAPIKRIVGLFTKNEKYKKQISDVLYAILIFMMAGQAGGDAVSYIKKAGYLKGGIYALKSLVKGKEVHSLIKGVIEDL